MLMKSTYLLYPIISENIANVKQHYWALIDADTNKILYNPYIQTRSLKLDKNYIDRLIFFSYHTAHNHRLLSSLLNDRKSVPHEIIDTTIPGNHLTNFILPIGLIVFRDLFKSAINENDEITFEEPSYFDEYREGINNWVNSIIYYEYLDHVAVSEHALTSDEGYILESYYGPSNDGYTKRYSIYYDSGQALSFEDKKYRKLKEDLKSFSSISWGDVFLTISSNVPIFLRDHNRVQEQLQKLNLHSLDN